LRVFLEINRWSWNAPPSIDDAELAMLAIAAGDWDHEQMAAWLADRISPSEAP
jgi:hypothetical protein